MNVAMKTIFYQVTGGKIFLINTYHTVRLGRRVIICVRRLITVSVKGHHTESGLSRFSSLPLVNDRTAILKRTTSRP
jgi:hypothetical protein